MPMRTYFLGFLLFPAALAGLSSVFSFTEGLVFVALFALIPYAVTVLVLAPFIWRAPTCTHLLPVAFAAPVLMSVFELAFLMAVDPPELRSLARLFQLFLETVPITLGVSFAFVGLVWGILCLARKLGWVRALPRRRPLSRHRVSREIDD
jgi:hypothetical protein